MTDYQGEVLKIALGYYDRGLCVIPVEYSSKSPGIASWKEYQLRRPAREQVEAWFSDGRDHNIGVILGRPSGGLVAVCFNDISRYKLAFSGEDPKTFTKVHRTHRGFHVLVETDIDVGLKFSLDAIIEIRGGGGYIVMPPSLHPSGISYQDTNPEVEDILFIPDFWDWIERRAFKAGFIIADGDFVPSPEWVEDILTNTVGAGSRDNTCFKLACYLLKYWDREKVAEYLDQWNQTICEPPLSHRTVEEKVRSAANYVTPEKREGRRRADEEKVNETSFFTLPDGTISEEVRDPETGKLSFAVYHEGDITYEDGVRYEDKIYRPIQNDMTEKGVVKFPSEAVPYGDVSSLIGDIQSFINRYVDLRPNFERLASYYVLLTWVYDAFDAIPYLQFLGGPQTGKSRAATVISAITYKPVFISGSTTMSPMFRIIEQFGGTLTINEADAAEGDEYSDQIKMLNTGYEKGSPLLRSERGKGDMLEARAYNLYSPKIVAVRHKYKDRALQSRFLTEKMDRKYNRKKYSLNLPRRFHAEALELRNRLLYFRLSKLQGIEPELVYGEPGIEPRVWQVLSPIMQLIEEPKDREELKKYARMYTQDIRQDRTESLLGEVVDIFFSLLDEGDDRPRVKDICTKVNEKYHGVKDALTPKKVAGLARELGLTTKRDRQGLLIDLEASKESIELIRRQYDVVPQGVKGGEDKGEELRRRGG